MLDLSKKYAEVCPKQQRQLLSTLQTILNKGSQQDAAVFIQNETEHQLIKEMTTFYETEIYKYVNSNLIFDNESDIIKAMSNCELLLSAKLSSLE